jgi:hypothetical protein
MSEELKPTYQDDEIDLRELFVSMWKKRYVALFVALLGMFIGAAAFLIKGAGSPVDSYSMEVRLTFKGAASGEYPNGSSYRINDLIAADVLEQLYSQNSNLMDSGFSFEDFASSFSVTPINPNREFIDAKYKGQLGNSKLSATEIDELNVRYKTELAADTGRYLRLGFQVSSLAGLDANQVNNVLADLPRVWAENAINSKGVLDLTIVVPPQVDQYILDNSEFVVVAEYLRNYASKLLKSAQQINSDSVASLVSDPKSGLDSGEVINQLNDLNLFHLNVLSRVFSIEPIATSKNEANLYLKSRIAEVDESLDELDRKAEIITKVYNDYIKTSGQALGGDIADTQGSGSYSPQYGDGFLTKLMTIGDELSDAKFKQDLLNKRIEFNLEAQELKTERKRLSDALNALNALNAESDELSQLANASSASDKLSAQAVVEREAKYIVGRLNELSSVMNGIVTARQAVLLGNTGALYELSTSPVRYNNTVPMLVQAVKYSLIGLLAGLMLGMMLALVLGALSKKRD